MLQVASELDLAGRDDECGYIVDVTFVLRLLIHRTALRTLMQLTPRIHVARCRSLTGFAMQRQALVKVQ